MAWVQSNGTSIPHAENYIDLLDIFHAYCLANGAVEMEFVSGSHNILKLTGSGDDEILFGAKIFTDIPGNNYAWILNGFTGYTNGQEWDNQLGAVIRSPAALPLWNTTIPYWIFINSRRVILVAKVSTGYHMAYFGLILPYGTPAQWPYPLCVSGTTYRSDDDANNSMKPYLFSLDDSRVSSFWNPLYEERSIGTLLIRTNSGWRRLRHQPTGTYSQTGTLPYYIQGRNNFRLAPDGTFQRSAIQILDGQEPKGVLGTFDGLFFVPGVGLAAESVHTDPGTSEEFFAFPNTSREGVGHWVLVKKA